MKVIIPGSYDPITLGHLDIIKRAAAQFDEVYVVAFINPSKKYLFSVDDRVAMMMLATDEFDNVLVSYSDGRVVDYMREHGIEQIIKGYRTEADLPWEREQAEYNKKHGGYETDLWLCREGYEEISSTLARKKLSAGENCENILPKPVIDYIKAQKK